MSSMANDTSDLQDVARWFTAPSEDEVKRIEASIPRMTREIELLSEQEIELRLKREQLFKDINFAHSILAPVRRLNNDVLHEIFFHCIEMDHTIGLDHNPAIFTLMSVCAGWKKLLLETPSLWTLWNIAISRPANQFTFPFGPMPVQSSFPHDQTLLAIKLSSLFERSSAAPLHINLISTTTVTHDLLDVVFSHSSHLEHLGIYSSLVPHSLMTRLRPYPKLPMLKSLDIPSLWSVSSVNGHDHGPGAFDTGLDVFDNWILQQQNTGFIYLFTGSSAICDLSCDARMVPILRSDCCWGKMTHLRLEMARNIQDLMETLKECIMLQKLELSFHPHPQFPSNEDHITFNDLNSLTIYLTHEIHQDQIFKYFILPSLEELNILRDRSFYHVVDAQLLRQLSEGSLYEKLYELLQRSCCSLLRFRVQHTPMAAESVVSCLELVGHRIQELELTYTSATNLELLNWMTCDPESSEPNILPDLDTVLLRDPPGRPADYLTRMVESRTRPVSEKTVLPPPTKLKKVVVNDDEIDLFKLRYGAKIRDFELFALSELTVEAHSYSRSWFDKYHSLI